MTPYCTDIDLLNFEPNILKDAAFASQTLLSGTCDVSGTDLTIPSGSLADAHAEARMVIVLGGSLAGTYAIVSVDSDTTMTISPMYSGLFPEDGSDPIPTPVGSASSISFVIRTFWPQRRMISEILSQAAGIIPGDVLSENQTILNPQALRPACMLGTLQLIYSALSALTDAPKQYQTRADLYERLYRRALRSTRVEIDTNGDGRADSHRLLNIVELIRT